jgi:hypothetical protein
MDCRSSRRFLTSRLTLTAPDAPAPPKPRKRAAAVSPETNGSNGTHESHVSKKTVMISVPDLLKLMGDALIEMSRKT